MTAPTYAGLLGIGFVLALGVLAGAIVYLVDRRYARRHAPARHPLDPYAEACALAARRRPDSVRVGRAPTPTPALARASGAMPLGHAHAVPDPVCLPPRPGQPRLRARAS